MPNYDYSLLDANFVRAREGLRVLDEIARFEFRDEGTFSTLKELRHEVMKLELAFPSYELIASRFGDDVGAELSVVSGHHRLLDIIRANCNRVTESLRVLEEFCRVYSPKNAVRFAEIRYAVYLQEIALLQQTPHYFLQRYFGTGSVYPLVETLSESIWLVERGAKIIQFRDKSSSSETILRKAQELCRFISWHNKTTPEKVLLILNDSVTIASQLPVAGVHLGQRDGSVARARQILGTNKIIGRSNNTIFEVRQSVVEGADYISVGPVFPTPTKPDRPAVGLDFVRQVAEEVRVPLVAIGGINSTNIHEVHGTGVKNVAVVRSAREFF